MNVQRKPEVLIRLSLSACLRCLFVLACQLRPVQSCGKLCGCSKPKLSPLYKDTHFMYSNYPLSSSFVIFLHDLSSLHRQMPIVPDLWLVCIQTSNRSTVGVLDTDIRRTSKTLSISPTLHFCFTQYFSVTQCIYSVTVWSLCFALYTQIMRASDSDRDDILHRVWHISYQHDVRQFIINWQNVL